MRDGAAIAAALGGRRNGKGWSFCCPCHDDRVPSCSLRDDGLITCFAGCRRADVLAALDALGFPDDGRATIPQTNDYEARIRAAQAEWNDAVELSRIVGAVSLTSVEWYLRHRGITLPVPAVLRRAPSDRRWGNSGVMACVQRLDGIVTAIQIKSLGNSPMTFGWPGRGAVQLNPPCDGELGLAEGIESALSATQLHGVPCWATLGALRLHLIDLPSCVRRVHLFADNDRAGRSAVDMAKARYTNQLLPVRTWWPPENQDWNDVLKGKEQ
jgi:putative DNA primase/helicase